MSLAFIGLGSNLGDGCHNLQKAWQQTGDQPQITTLAISSPYLTKPVNKKAWEAKGKKLSDQLFTNAVGVLETDLPPQRLLEILKKIESAMGRERSKTVDRPVDLDILYYDDLVVSEAELELPHPEMKYRPFVLIPLAEIAPDHPHPVSGSTTRQMMRSLPICESGEIRQISWPDKRDSFIPGADKA
ncbi:MAG: 2-amino-4-hydroxy-6-hydroxymethyldihydropteridine diphosphokinase [Thermodesulfobacteriota bacterium]